MTDWTDNGRTVDMNQNIIANDPSKILDKFASIIFCIRVDGEYLSGSIRQVSQLSSLVRDEYQERIRVQNLLLTKIPRVRP